MKVKNNSYNDNIRASYQIFPNIFQPFFTWLTGKALKNQKPTFVLSVWFHFIVPFFMFFVGICSCYSILQGPVSWLYCFIPLTWVLTVAGTRNMVLTIRHECVHKRFTSSALVNKILGELVTILLVVRTAKAYQYDHVTMHHNRDILATRKDPHVEYMSGCGLQLGMSYKQLWRVFILTLISPRFYLKSTYERIKANVCAENKTRRFSAIIFFLALIIFFLLSNISFLDVIISIYIPLFVLSTASSLIETIVEHPVPLESNTTKIICKKEIVAIKSWSILSGARLPDSTANPIRLLISWSAWILKMCGHLIIRMTILPGPLPSHEMHHRKPGQYDWRIAFYEKQKDIDAGHPGWPAYREIWGLASALKLVFKDMAEWNVSYEKY